jgi:ribosome production factor 1
MSSGKPQLTAEKQRLLALNTSDILNAKKRQEVFARQKKLKNDLKTETKKRKLRELELLGIDDAPVRSKPRTIENTTEANPTVVLLGDESIQGEEAMDEFSGFYNKEVTPKLCITTCLKPSKRCYSFVRELLYVFPNSFFYPRKGFTVKQIAENCAENDFTDVIIINEDNKKINGLTVQHLPEGPTAFFQLRRVTLNSELPGNPGELEHLSRPEILLNRFTSRVGRRTARILSALFHIEPDFKGRRVITFHNQRDFIFFRHHRYIFERVGKAEAENDAEVKKLQEKARLAAKLRKLGKKHQRLHDQLKDAPKLLEGESIINNAKVRCKIQEIGPQFTMRLKWIQHGIFDKQHGEYEWKMNNDMKTHKKKFHL